VRFVLFGEAAYRTYANTLAALARQNTQIHLLES